MHRFALAALVLTGCRFDADYGGGRYRCSDGVCPPGLVCQGGACVDSEDPVDAAGDGGSPDAAAARTCADPGVIERDGARVFLGTTEVGQSSIAGRCDGRIFNGPDHIYRGTALAGDRLAITIDGDAHVRAYVLDTCPASGTPDCLGGMLARPGFALALPDLPAGDLHVIVDTELAAQGAAYTLTVTLAP
jgi:hypothetical protein